MIVDGCFYSFSASIYVHDHNNVELGRAGFFRPIVFGQFSTAFFGHCVHFGAVGHCGLPTTGTAHGLARSQPYDNDHDSDDYSCCIGIKFIVFMMYIFQIGFFF